MSPEPELRIPASSSVLRLIPRIAILMVLALVGLVVLFVLLPPVDKLRETHKRSRCKSNLRQINIALHLYADDNAGAFPENFCQVYRGNYTDNVKLFSCPSAPSKYEDFKFGVITDKSSSYTYVPGLSSGMPGYFIIAYDKALNNHKECSEVGRNFEGGRNVLFIDGTAFWPASREPEFQRWQALQKEAVEKWRASGKPIEAFSEFVSPELRQIKRPRESE